jgi:hypothetical protein
MSYTANQQAEHDQLVAVSTALSNLKLVMAAAQPIITQLNPNGKSLPDVVAVATFLATDPVTRLSGGADALLDMDTVG